MENPAGYPDLLSAGRPADAESQLPRRPRRWPIAAAAVVAAVLLAAGTVLLADDGHHAIRAKSAGPSPTPTTIPAPSTTVLTPPSTTPGDGSTEDALLPEGAPSMPPTGELLAMLGVRHTGGFRLYADGRLIHIWSFTEQRLTPEGVERVRSRFLSSGLFDSAQPLSDVADCPGPVTACVRDGDHWLGVAVDNADPGPSTAPPEAVRLYDDLRTLDATLPATAWIDPQHKPYVPARIATCFTMFANRTPVPIDLSALVSRFPEQAAGVLAAHEPSAEMQRVMAPLIDHEVGCFELTRDEARTLADAFLAPSGGGAHEYWGIVLRFGRQPDPAQPGATREEGAYIRFEQLLPDNVPVGSFGD